MKKFQFSLDRMRNYKDQILGEEKNALGVLKRKQAEIENQIDALEESFEEISEQMSFDQKTGTTALKLQGYSMQLSNIRRQLEQLRKDQKSVQIEVDQQMKVVVAASQEVSKLDKLQDKQYELYQKDVQRDENLRIEELVTSSIIRREAMS